jgi:hypothetical protein
MEMTTVRTYRSHDDRHFPIRSTAGPIIHSISRGSRCAPRREPPDVALPMWPSRCGPPDVALPMWPSRCGPPDVALPMWPSRCGPPNVALPMWPSRCGPSDVALSMWPSQCGPPNVALPMWRGFDFFLCGVPIWSTRAHNGSFSSTVERLELPSRTRGCQSCFA